MYRYRDQHWWGLNSWVAAAVLVTVISYGWFVSRPATNNTAMIVGQATWFIVTFLLLLAGVAVAASFVRQPNARPLLLGVVTGGLLAAAIVSPIYLAPGSLGLKLLLSTILALVALAQSTRAEGRRLAMGLSGVAIGVAVFVAGSALV